MWRFEATLLCCLCVATILLPPCTLAGSQSKYGQKCDVAVLNDECGPHERCKQESEKTGAKCTCEQGYEYVDQECKKTPSTEASTEGKRRQMTSTSSEKPDINSTSSEGGNSVAAILLVPTCLIVIGALAYFGARRYKWLQRFRQFRQNRYGSVLVTRDDTDDDDPPLA